MKEGDFLNFILKYVVPSLITGIFAYIATYKPFSKGIAIETAKLRFYKAYNPLFLEIEPTLYQEISLQNAQKQSETFKKVLTACPELLNPVLAYRIKEFLDVLSENKVDQNLYHSICYFVDKESDKLRKQLHLPRRSFLLKYQLRQFPKSDLDDFDFVFDFIKELLFSFVKLLLLAFVFFIIQIAFSFLLSIINN